MGDQTAISWADATFNPWIGCTKVSVGAQGACVGCYAEAQAKRYGWAEWGDYPRHRTSLGNWAKPLAWNRKAEREGTHPFVFCASLADVFDNQIDPTWRRDLFDLIRATPNLVWLLLTKRPQNIVRLWFETYTDESGPPVALTSDFWPRNAAIGCTVVTQAEADRDIPVLLAAKAALNPAFAFVSMEPLMGAVDISPYLGYNWDHGRQQAERGIRLPGGAFRRPRDHAGRNDLAGAETPLGSLAEQGDQPPLQEGPGGARRGEVLSGQGDAERRSHPRSGPPAGVSSLQGTNPAGDDGQPRERTAQAQPPGQSGASHALGSADARRSRAEDEPPGASTWRGEHERQADGHAGDVDPDAPRDRREVAGDSRRLRHRDADGLQDRAWGPPGGLDWTISGGETDQGGHKARPSSPQWFRDIRDQCATAGVAYHHKQNGEWVSVSEVEGPGAHYEFPDGRTVRRAGKHHAGRTIDGVLHDARPRIIARTEES